MSADESFTRHVHTTPGMRDLWAPDAAVWVQPFIPDPVVQAHDVRLWEQEMSQA